MENFVVSGKSWSDGEIVDFSVVPTFDTREEAAEQARQMLDWDNVIPGSIEISPVSK